MSPRDWRDRIADILDAIQAVQQYVVDMDYEAFVGDSKTVQAATYELIIVGEAVRGLSVDVRAKYREIPWDKMQAVRNIAVHEYFRVDPTVLWGIISQNLPPLVEPLRRLLEGVE